MTGFFKHLVFPSFTLPLTLFLSPPSQSSGTRPAAAGAVSALTGPLPLAQLRCLLVSTPSGCARVSTGVSITQMSFYLISELETQHEDEGDADPTRRVPCAEFRVHGAFLPI